MGSDSGEGRILSQNVLFLRCQGTVFDYHVDEHSCSMVHWESRVTPFIYQPGNFASNFVSTVETARITYLLELLISRNNHVMLVGNTGAQGHSPRFEHGFQVSLLHLQVLLAADSTFKTCVTSVLPHFLKFLSMLYCIERHAASPMRAANIIENANAFKSPSNTETWPFFNAKSAGTGKSAVMRNVLAGLEGDNIISTTINLNSFSDAPSLQPILENPLEKKSGGARSSMPA